MLPIPQNVRNAAGAANTQQAASKPPSYPAPAKDPVSAMPNASKLTPTERKIYATLPGISTFTGKYLTPLSNALDKFTGGWAGKALGALDILAEGAERAAGFADQIYYAATQGSLKNFDTLNEIKAAWYAGSLLSDTTNLPMFIKEKNPYYDPKNPASQEEVITGVRIPTDLPGINGIVEARKKILAEITAGGDAGDALIKAKDEYYSSLGALTLRAQLYDTYFHVLGDPLNAVSGALKPIEKLHALRNIGLYEKIGVGSVDVLAHADELAKAATLEKNLQTAGKLTAEAERFAKIGERLQEAEKITELASAAKRAGKYGEALSLGLKAEKMRKEAGAVTSLEKLAISITGGEVGKTSKTIEALRKVPVVKWGINAFSLTPESKAMELINTMSDSFASILSKADDFSADGIAKLEQTINRISTGSTGVEHGHAMLTLGGRTAQSFAHGSEALTSDIFKAYRAIADERELLKAWSGATAISPTKLLEMAGKDAGALAKLLLEKGIPDTTPQMIKTLAETLKDAGGRMLPYTDELLIPSLLDAIETHAMRQATTQFGVKARGVITRWSHALKSAEVLAFMKLNPANAVRNVVNNEITMVARGLFGTLDNEGIDAFWKTTNILPKRLQESFGATAGDVVEGVGAQKVLGEALRGGNYGTPEKIQDFFRDIASGKTSISGWSQAMEASASKRAFTHGYMQFQQKYVKAQILTKISPDILSQVPKEIQEALVHAEKSAMGRAAVFDELTKMNLNLTPSAVMTEASRKLGFNVEEYLGTEGVAYLTEHMTKALQSGKVDDFVRDFHALQDKHVTDLWEKSVANLTDNIKDQVIAGGPQAWYQTLGDTHLMWMDGEMEWAMRASGATEKLQLARQSGNWAQVDSIFERMFSDADKHFALYEKRMNAVYDGLEGGWKHLAQDAKARGLNFNLPPLTEVRKSFNETRNAMRDAFAFRAKSYRDYFALAPKDRVTPFEDIQRIVGERFKKAFALEDTVMRRADEAVASHMENQLQRQAFLNYRDQVAQVRTSMREAAQATQDAVLAAPVAERTPLWQAFWAQRQKDLENIRNLDSWGTGILQRDAGAMQRFQVGGNAKREAARMVEAGPIDYMNKHGISINKKEFSDIFGGKLGVDKQGVPPGLFSEEGFGLDEVATMLQEGGFITADKASDLNYVRDFIRNSVGNGAEAQAKKIEAMLNREADNISDQFIADVKKLVPDHMPLDLITEQAVYGRSKTAIDAVLDAAYVQMEKKSALLKDLPENVQEAVNRALLQVKDGFAEQNMAALKFAEFRRDSALLNYNRRTNFDSAVSNVFPFVFWTTGSMAKWAIHSLDRPAMFTTYLRMKKFLETAGAPEAGFPSRFKDNIRVNLPFAPEWMGRQFVNPLNFLLPFDAFAQPFERWQKAQTTAEGRADRLMQEQVKNGEITQQEYETAIANKSGDVWDFALAQARENDENSRYDAWDFASAISSPHAPVMWAYLAATGQADEIGPFTPASRILRNAFTALGVKDYNNSPYNIEAKVRKSLGLPAFDKWDTYRVQREMSNLAASGKYSVEEVKRAMILADQEAAGQVTHDVAMANPLYAEAVEKSNQEYTGGVAGFALSLLGIKVNSYPEGERQLRTLSDQFGKAYEAEHAVQEKFDAFQKAHPQYSDEEAMMAFESQFPKDAANFNALAAFFDEHPEYEARLGLFDKPEVRLQKFLVDEVWATWNALPTVTKNELKDQLGTQFSTQFLDRETRATDSISSEQLSIWLKFMGGDSPMIMTADQNMLISLFQGQLKLTDPETAWRAEVFYGTRKKLFGNYYDLQKEYYALPQSKRKAYLAANPDLARYWDWRRDFMGKNPDLVPYLTDDPKAIQKALGAKRNANLTGVVPTRQELASQMTLETQQLLTLTVQNGEQMSDDLEYMLLRIGVNYGLTPEQVAQIMAGG